MRQTTKSTTSSPEKTSLKVEALAPLETDAEVVAFRAAFDGLSPLDDLVRQGARQMLQAALESEVQLFLDQHLAKVDDQGRRLVVRNAFKAFRPDFPLRAGDTTFYEQLADLLLPNRRFTLLDDLDVLYTLPFGFYAGLRYSAGAPLYGPENGVGDNATHRLGPFVVWRLFDHDGAAFNQPTIALLVNWYLKHPYRTGGLDSQTAVPYFAIAFQTNGDLISLPPVSRPQEPKN